MKNQKITVPEKIVPSAVFDEGYSAHVEGLGMESNPYSRDDDLHLTWNDGFKKSEDDFENGGE